LEWGTAFVGRAMKYSVGIIIVSDRAASGERKDECLPVFYATLDNKQFTITETDIIPDEPSAIKALLEHLIEKECALIFTSGGTGCGPRDITPDITRKLLDKPTPGLDEAIRSFSTNKSRFAVFSRAVSGVAGKSFIVNLPGSPKAVGEILEYLNPIIAHPLKLLSGHITDCVKETAVDD